MSAPMQTITIKHNDIKTRDFAFIALINGATKAGFQKNRKHDANKKACRKPVRGEW